MKVKLLTGTSKKRVEERLKIVCAAGKLSRFPGKVTEVYKLCVDPEKNKRFINRVIGMGHDSITDHDYLVFALEDVSPIIEQILIEERIASFTIKSRREGDFREVGYYTPNFRGEDFNVLDNNDELKKMYKNHMNYLFDSYGQLLEMGLKKEDARFVLPYSFNSNIIMGCDAHVLKNLIVRFTKGKESKISELKELGEKFYDISCKYVPYLKDVIDNASIPESDKVADFLGQYLDDDTNYIPKKVKLISATKDVDKEILVSAIMRVKDYPYEKAEKVYENKFANDENLKKELMHTILVNGGKEFTQVNFRFDIPISLAVLTHITRHRTHELIVPDFTPIRDLTKYRKPPTLNEDCEKKFAEVYEKNEEIYLKFKKMGVCDEDLIYFYLAGTMVNVFTNMDGKTLSHIARLRICTKAQWEIRDVVLQMRELVLEKAPIYGGTLGPDCEIFLECHEGRESCGKVKVLREKAGIKDNQSTE